MVICFRHLVEMRLQVIKIVRETVIVSVINSFWLWNIITTWIKIRLDWYNIILRINLSSYFFLDFFILLLGVIPNLVFNILIRWTQEMLLTPSVVILRKWWHLSFFGQFIKIINNFLPIEKIKFKLSVIIFLIWSTFKLW